MSKSVCISHAGGFSIPCAGTNRVIAFADVLKKNGFDMHLVIPNPVNKSTVSLEYVDHVKQKVNYEDRACLRWA